MITRYETTSFTLKRFNTKTSTYEAIVCYDTELEKLPEVNTNGKETKKEDSESCAKIEQVEEQI